MSVNTVAEASLILEATFLRLGMCVNRVTISCLWSVEKKRGGYPSCHQTIIDLKK